MATQARYFANSTSPTQHANAHEELIASLTRINTYNPPVQTCSTGWTFSGLYYGPTSVAYLFYRLSEIYPDLNFKGQSLLDWAQSYLDLGIYGRRHAVDASHCGIGVEELAQLAVRAAIEKDGSLAQKLCSYEPIINVEGEGSDEWLYGRSGYLYLLRLSRSGIINDDSKAVKMIDKTIQATVTRILSTKQPWIWHGKQYLGAAHGTFGILCQVVLSSPESASFLESILIKLLEIQLPSGNFPSSYPPGSDKLVQFCHGGPGAILALRSLRPYSPSLQSKIDHAISMAQKDIMRRGVLSKEPCLCHGISGNALALDNDVHFHHLLAYSGTDNLESQGWLDEAGKSDQFVGLFTGEAGRAWAWAVADKGLKRTCIGFDDL